MFGRVRPETSNSITIINYLGLKSLIVKAGEVMAGQIEAASMIHRLGMPRAALHAEIPRLC